MASIMNLHRLRHFEAVYRLRSFARAADEQRLTQSALSRSLQKLESELGTRLFDRTTHSVTATDSAEKLIRRARDTIQAAAMLVGEARALGQPTSGSIRVGCGPYPMQAVLMPAIARFAVELPGVQVTVKGGDSAQLLEALVNRTLDLVVCDRSKFDHSAYADHIVAIPLPDEPLVLVCAHDHPVARGARASSAAWAIPRPAPGSMTRMSPSLRARMAAGTFPDFELDSTAACLDLARAGRAITIIPASIAASSGLHVISLPPAERTADAIHVLKGRSRSVALTRLVDLLRADREP